MLFFNIIKERLVVRMIIDKSNCGEGKGMRYDAEWLMECLLMKIKSTRAYKHLRTNCLLPLPCPDTIRRLLSSMPCNFGFNEEALLSIKRQLEGLDLNLRRGSLVWDEMSLTKHVKYDAQKMHFEGFIDYGPEGIEDRNVDFTEQMADHALVFIFRPYRSSWIQPIAVFAIKGAAPGHVISRLATKAIVALEAVSARVTSVTCDGAQTNKTAWADFGIRGSPDEDGNISCSIEHPTSTELGEKIWFLQDVPHLFKCVRNFIFTRQRMVRPRRKKTVKAKGAESAIDLAQEFPSAAESHFYNDKIQVQTCVRTSIYFNNECILQFKGKEVRHSDFVRLFNYDKPEQGGMGIAFRLTDEHIHPNSFSKMNVRLMAQVHIIILNIFLL